MALRALSSALQYARFDIGLVGKSILVFKFLRSQLTRTSPEGAEVSAAQARVVSFCWPTFCC